MKFKKYISETKSPFKVDSDTAESIAKKLKKDCKPFLNEMKKIVSLNWMYRATEKQVKEIKKITPRTNRKPRNMPIEMHEKLDNMFYKRFKWKPRSEGVFTSSDIWQLESVYGNPYMFFPIGEYKYIYNPKIVDIYMTLDRNFNLSYAQYYQDFEQEKREKEEKRALEYLDIVIPEYTDKNLYGSYKRGVEVTFKCKSYYLVSRLYEDILKEIIYGLK